MRERLLLISCMAAMADAAVMLPFVWPREKSFAPLSCRMFSRMDWIYSTRYGGSAGVENHVTPDRLSPRCTSFDQSRRSSTSKPEASVTSSLLCDAMSAFLSTIWSSLSA